MSARSFTQGFSHEVNIALSIRNTIIIYISLFFIVTPMSFCDASTLRKLSGVGSASSALSANATAAKTPFPGKEFSTTPSAFGVHPFASEGDLVTTYSPQIFLPRKYMDTQSGGLVQRKSGCPMETATQR